MNPRISKKEYGLIKGALRRVFSRSDLRKTAIEATIVPASDVSLEMREKRFRVKTWCKCPSCQGFFAKSDMQVDHVVPIVPVDRLTEDVSPTEMVDRMWCGIEGLQAICKPCHIIKTKAENKLRRAWKKQLALSLTTEVGLENVKKRKGAKT